MKFMSAFSKKPCYFNSFLEEKNFNLWNLMKFEREHGNINHLFWSLWPWIILLFNWELLHARLNNHYKAWSYNKKKYKQIKAYSKSI